MTTAFFEVDQARARGWLAQEAKTEGPAWFAPLEPGMEAQAISLVEEAQRRAVLHGPVHARLIHAADEDGGACYVLLDLAGWHHGGLASSALRWPDIAGPTGTGAEAAMSVLWHTSNAANAVLRDLRHFVRACEDAAAQRAAEEALLVEHGGAKPLRVISSDVAVTRDQLVPGMVVRRWTEFVRGSRYGPGCTVTTRVPCCDRKVRLQYQPDDDPTDPVLCAHCRVIYDHELIPDSDEGYWAVLVVRRITFIPTMRTEKKGRTLR